MTDRNLFHKYEDTEFGRSWFSVDLTGDQVGIEQGIGDGYDDYIDIVYIDPEDLSEVITALIKVQAMIEEEK